MERSVCVGWGFVREEGRAVRQEEQTTSYGGGFDAWGMVVYCGGMEHFERITIWLVRNTVRVAGRAI